MSRPAAPTGTMRAACDELVKDLEAAVQKFRARLADFASEEMSREELVAITPTQVRLVAASTNLDRIARELLSATVRMRDVAGIPLGEAEVESSCGCDDCRSKVAARTVN